MNLISSFFYYFQEIINPSICFLISKREHFENKLNIYKCNFQFFNYNDKGSVIYIINVIEKCLFEECLFQNCNSNNNGGSIFIDFLLLNIIISKNCVYNSSTSLDYSGQFFYSYSHNNLIINSLSTNNCSLNNNGYSIIWTKKGNNEFKYSNTSNHKLYHIILNFGSNDNNYINISYNNINNNYLIHSLVILFHNGNLMKNIIFLNLINNSHGLNYWSHVENFATNILFNYCIIFGNSHNLFGNNDGGISTIKNSFLNGIYGSINYLNSNNSLTFKETFKINHYQTGNCIVEFYLFENCCYSKNFKKFFNFYFLFYYLNIFENI